MRVSDTPTQSSLLQLSMNLLQLFRLLENASTHEALGLMPLYFMPIKGATSVQRTAFNQL